MRRKLQERHGKLSEVVRLGEVVPQETVHKEVNRYAYMLRPGESAYAYHGIHICDRAKKKHWLESIPPSPADGILVVQTPAARAESPSIVAIDDLEGLRRLLSLLPPSLHRYCDISWPDRTLHFEFQSQLQQGKSQCNR